MTPPRDNMISDILQRGGKGMTWWKPRSDSGERRSMIEEERRKKPRINGQFEAR
jgi:hypothetical protein